SLYPIAIDYAFNAINNKNLKDLMYIPIFIIILTVAKGISYFYQTIYVGKISNSVIKEIQLNLYNKVVNFDILLMGQFKQGSLQSRFINDLNILREAITRILNNLIRDLFTLFGLLISMIYLDWLLTLCVILIYPLCIKPIIFIGKSTRKHSLKLQEKIASAGAFLSESFSSIAVIKTFNLEGLQKKKAEKKFSDIYRKNIEIIRVRSKVEPTLEIIGGLAISSVIVIAGLRVNSGHIDIGSFSGFISALLIAVQPARALGTLNTVLQEGGASLLRLDDILKKENKIISIKKPKSFEKVKGEITFKNIFFSYDKKINSLNSINIKIKARENLVLVGSNGSGKSTFINLIPRLIDPYKGKISIDGIDIKSLEITKLRSKISLVSQDIILFDLSIIENLKLANETANLDDIIKACKIADAHNFITKFKNGYKTIVGERGLKLSGGQRQKIAIARALLKKPKILLLDEATSALDNFSETKILRSLNQYTRNITTITIAHRVSTILNAKRILFFKDGKIVDQGKHMQLMKKNLEYKKHFLTNYN
ncbi:MAG: Lipid A export ATP-binding/permease protein MsbA, partial [Alphaproteobacteria bacterium MarineAlpha9_Bin4]